MNKSIERFQLRKDVYGFVLVSVYNHEINIYDKEIQLALNYVNTTIATFAAPKGFCWRYYPYNKDTIKTPFFVPFPFDFSRHDSKNANDIIFHYQIWSWSRIQFPIKKGEYFVLNETFAENAYLPCLTYIYLQHLQLIKDLCSESVEFPEKSEQISKLMSLVNISLHNFKSMLGKRQLNINYKTTLNCIRKSMNTLQTMKRLQKCMHPIDFIGTLVYAFENDMHFFGTIPGSSIIVDVIYLGNMQNNTVLWKRFQLCKVFNLLEGNMDCIDSRKKESCAKKLINFAESRLFCEISKLYICNHIVYKMIQVEKSGSKQMLDSIKHGQKCIQECKHKLVMLIRNIEKVNAEHIANSIAVRMLGGKVSIDDFNSTWSLDVFKTIYSLGMHNEHLEGIVYVNEICTSTKLC